jgi:Uma2 family endonuclease
MSAIPESGVTYEQYLSREQTATYKTEYYRGELFAMVGGTPQHNTISGNVFSRLRGKLRGSNCRPFNSDQRIRIADIGLATYPDVSIVCGDLQLDEQDRDAITNPVVLFEVLSKSTERYDRGKKFDLYRHLNSFKEYVLVDQNEPYVESFLRQEDGSWVLNVFKHIDAILPLSSVNCELPLSEIYEDVEFTDTEE